MSTLSLPPTSTVDRKFHIYSRMKESDFDDTKSTIRHHLTEGREQEFAIMGPPDFNQQVMRHSIDDGRDWGFSILRCTYKSQSEWDLFLSKIRDDLDGYFAFPADSDLRAKLRCPIVEDQTKLDNATWREASVVFNDMLMDDLQKAKPDAKWTEDKISWAIYGIPRQQFFIYADQASVDSVIKCGESGVAKRGRRKYFFTLVRNADYSFLDGEDAADLEDTLNSEFRLESRQNFKVWMFPAVYAAILEDAWYDCIPGDDGISTV